MTLDKWYIAFMEKITHFSFEETDGNLVVHLNPNAARNLPSSVLEDPAIDRLPFSGKKTLLEGMAPNWMYAHLAVKAVMNGTEELSVRQAGVGDTLIWKRGPLLTADGYTQTPCFTITKNDSDTVYLEFINGPDEKGGKWTMEDLIKTPLCFSVSPTPDKNEVLIIWGLAANWMCAAVAVTAYSSGINYILYGSPREKAYISIGTLNPGKLVQYKKRTKNGFVIGIAGDPNSGKSVFMDWLEKIIKDERLDSWCYDADHASPTPPWYLDGLNSGQTEVEDMRKKIKKKWTHEFELKIADDLRNLRENLDIALVDLPGGRVNDTPPQRIPDGREVVFKEIDLFIILWKNEAVREGWLSALREHNMENRVFAEIESREPDSPPSLETRSDGRIIIGTARGLNRVNTGYSVKQLIKPGAAEIIRRISALITSGMQTP
jgi:hypothetical protein